MAEDRYTRITLRIPKETHKALQEAADARSHSMNAEIVQRLEDSLMPQTREEIASFYLANLSDPRLVLGNLENMFHSFLSAQDYYKAAIEDKHAEKMEEVIAMYELKRTERVFMKYYDAAKKLGVDIPKNIKLFMDGMNSVRRYKKS